LLKNGQSRYNKKKKKKKKKNDNEDAKSTPGIKELNRYRPYFSYAARAT